MNEELDATTIRISSDLLGELEKQLDAAGFESIDGYVGYILRTVVTDLEAGFDHRPEDEEELLETLRGLGYIE